jgi:hypothetical protein
MSGNQSQRHALITDRENRDPLSNRMNRLIYWFKTTILRVLNDVCLTFHFLLSIHRNSRRWHFHKIYSITSSISHSGNETLSLLWTSYGCFKTTIHLQSGKPTEMSSLQILRMSLSKWTIRWTHFFLQNFVSIESLPNRKRNNWSLFTATVLPRFKDDPSLHAMRKCERNGKFSINFCRFRDC